MLRFAVLLNYIALCFVSNIYSSLIDMNRMGKILEALISHYGAV